MFVAYKISSGGRLTLRGMATYALVVLGVMACFDGFTLAYREENRARYGRASPPVWFSSGSVPPALKAPDISGAAADATRCAGVRS